MLVGDKLILLVLDNIRGQGPGGGVARPKHLIKGTRPQSLHVKYQKDNLLTKQVGALQRSVVLARVDISIISTVQIGATLDGRRGSNSWSVTEEKQVEGNNTA